MRRQRIIKDDLAVSRDVQTGTVAHEDRVRARGVRIPAEHDLLPRAGIEGNGTGVVDGPAKPAGRIAGEARSAVECEGTRTHGVAVLILGEIVINGAAVRRAVPGENGSIGKRQLVHVEYGSATVGSGVFNKGSLAQRSNPFVIKPPAHSSRILGKRGFRHHIQRIQIANGTPDLAGRVLNKRDRTVEAHVAFVDDRSAIASRAVLSERRGSQYRLGGQLGAPIAYGYGAACGLGAISRKRGAVIDTQLSRLHFDGPAVPSGTQQFNAVVLEKGVLPDVYILYAARAGRIVGISEVVFIIVNHIQRAASAALVAFKDNVVADRGKRFAVKTASRTSRTVDKTDVVSYFHNAVSSPDGSAGAVTYAFRIPELDAVTDNQLCGTLPVIGKVPHIKENGRAEGHGPFVSVARRRLQAVKGNILDGNSPGIHPLEPQARVGSAYRVPVAVDGQ